MSLTMKTGTSIQLNRNITQYKTDTKNYRLQIKAFQRYNYLLKKWKCIQVKNTVRNKTCKPAIIRKSAISSIKGKSQLTRCPSFVSTKTNDTFRPYHSFTISCDNRLSSQNTHGIETKHKHGAFIRTTRTAPPFSEN